MLKLSLRFLPLLFGLLSGAAHAVTATFNSPAALRDQPALSARAGAVVALHSSAEILSTRGFWAQVKTGQGTGWVKLNVLTLPADTLKANASPLSGVASGRVVQEVSR